LDPLPHLAIFERLVGTIRKPRSSDRLKALVTFGLYVEAECKYFRTHPTKNSETDIQNYVEFATSPERLQSVRDEAADLINAYSKSLIDKVRKDYETAHANHVKSAVDAAVAAVESSRKSLIIGVRDAVLGAFIYSIVLITVSVVAHRAGVDILELYGKMYGPGVK
jgi:hypothetical protein